VLSSRDIKLYTTQQKKITISKQRSRSAEGMTFYPKEEYFPFFDEAAISRSSDSASKQRDCLIKARTPEGRSHSWRK